MDFSAWVISGLMVVAGATWLIVYNADVLLGVTMRVLGRIRALAPVLQDGDGLSAAVRFRTGVTLAMFTLVVFTIVVGATTSRAFLRAVDDVESFGGGFDVRAEVAPHEPARRAGAPRSRGCRARPARLPRRRQRVGRCPAEVAAGRRAGRRARTTRARLRPRLPRRHDVRARRDARRATARRARSGTRCAAPRPRRGRPARRAAPRQLGLRRAARDFRLTGFYIEDGTFDPVPVEVRDPAVRTGADADRHRRARRHDAARHGRHLDVAADGGASSARRAPRPPSTTSRSRPASTRTRAARTLERALPRERHGGEVDPGGRSTTRSARRTRSTGCCSASWASG